MEKENVPKNIIKHKEFPGGRPSLSLLFIGALDAYKCGQLLALYEHRTSIEGFLWEVNSYDQWGVELGKVLAKRMREVLKTGQIAPELNSATKSLAQIYIQNK